MVIVVSMLAQEGRGIAERQVGSSMKACGGRPIMVMVRNCTDEREMLTMVSVEFMWAMVKG